MVMFKDSYKNKIAGFLNGFANKAKNFDEDTIMLIRDIWNNAMEKLEHISFNSFRTGGR
ncbi:hypothetical protein AB6G03_05605 [Providencia hangzhouensis]|uniref:hypothetical protein n=1 Tax=Providencia hangzhouensis TaxID=3031799 RepID=UPI0034DCE45C